MPNSKTRRYRGGAATHPTAHVNNIRRPVLTVKRLCPCGPVQVPGRREGESDGEGDFSGAPAVVGAADDTLVKFVDPLDPLMNKTTTEFRRLIS